MALRKKYLKSKPVCKVSFDLPVDVAPTAKKVELVGSFNNWEPISMRKNKTVFTKTVDLPVERSYEFRYRIDGEIWENDWSADAYVNNGFNAENSVVTL
jgi:1,4-alpha-glucan branching enzyme